VSKPPKKPATYEDLVALPETMVGEIIDGELFASPRPSIGHAHAGSALGAELWGPFNRGRGGPGGWWILDEVELHLGSDVLVPDIAGWRRSRMTNPPAPTEPFVTVAPDWICEVVSPSTETIDRARKLHIYAREHVTNTWLINPLTKTLEVMRLEKGKWVLQRVFSGAEYVRAEPFEAIELELSALWLPAPQEGP